MSMYELSVNNYDKDDNPIEPKAEPEYAVQYDASGHKVENPKQEIEVAPQRGYSGEIIEEPKEPKVEPANLSDEDRRAILKNAKSSGIKASQINSEKFGVDPASFMLEQTFMKAKEGGLNNKQYKTMMDKWLVDNDYDIKDFQDSEDGTTFDRFQTGLANSLMEMYVGGKELLNIEPSDTDKAQNELLYKQKKQKEAYHKYAEATMDDDGSMDSNFDLAGGFGELAPSVVLGLGVGGAATRGGLSLTKALTADLVAQQALSTMEYKGASELDEQAGTQYAFESGANVLGFGIGKVLGKIGKTAETPEFVKAVDDMGQAKAADVLETIKFAEENGIKIMGHDIDPGTQYSQLMEAASSNPVLSGKLKDVTEEDIGAITNYLSNIKNGYNDVMQTDSNMGQYVSRVIDGQEEAYDVAIKRAYEDMDAMMANNPSALTNETFTGWLDTVKTNVNKLDLTPRVRKHLQSTLDEYINDFQATGKSVNVASMYDMMRDTISEASRLSKSVDSNAVNESRAYAKLAEVFERQFDEMADAASNGNPQLQEVINAAKTKYKERVELFGYRDTGRGGKGTGFIPSFREKYAKDPEGAIKLVNTPEKVREIKAISGEGGDMVGMLQRHFLDQTTTKANGVPFSMEEAGKQLSNPKNQAMIKELYGSEAKQIDNLGKVMTILGKRERALSKSSSLVANEILNKGLVQAVPTAIKFLIGKYKGKKLVDADVFLIKGIEKEMQKKLGMSLEEYAANIKGSQVLPASVDIAKTADDLYTSPEGIPSKADGEAVQAEIQTAQEVANEARKAEVAQQTELQGVDRQLARQQTNLNKEIGTRFRTKKATPDDRLEYNRIQESIVTARNSGDREAVAEATSELSAFNEHTKNLPSRETTTEEAARIAIEKETARVKRVETARVDRIRREAEEAARLEQEAARLALEQEATRANATRVAQANNARREARREAERLATEARANAPRVQTTPERRTTANDNMVSNLNKNLEGSSWSVSNGEGGHPRFRDSETGANFTLHQYPDSMGATTVGLQNGSGAGEKIYHAIFDMAEELGVYYKPDSTLLTANPIRTGMNMISYMAKRGEDANHIMMSPSQKAIGTRGTDAYLGNKKLTLENANQLAMNMKALVNRKLPSGVNLSGSTTDEQIEAMASVTGGDPNTRLGPKSLKLLRRFMSSGRDLSAMGVILGLMAMDDDIMGLLGEPNQTNEEGL